MAGELELYNDVVNARLVLGINSREGFTLPQLYQGAQLPVKLWAVRPTNTTIAPFYSKESISSATLAIGIGPSAGAESLLAYQDSWSTISDGAGGYYFSGTLDLNTTELNAAISTSASLTTWMEVAISFNGVKRVTYQTPITVLACVIGPTGEVSLPESAEQYYTKNEIDSLFVKWVNDATANRGKMLALYSPDGSKIRSLGVDNNGAPIDYII